MIFSFVDSFRKAETAEYVNLIRVLALIISSFPILMEKTKLSLRMSYFMVESGSEVIPLPPVSMIKK